MFVFDLETHLFSPGNMAPKPVCLSTPTGIYTTDAADQLQQALEGRGPLVGHNVQYDFAVALGHWPHLASLIWKAYESGRVQCTAIREKLLDIASEGFAKKKGYSLARIARDRFKMELDKTTWRMDYAGLEGVPLEDWPSGAKQYAIDDAKTTARLFIVQAQDARQLKYNAFDKEAARQSSYGFVLQLMSIWGVRTDRDRVDPLEKTLRDRIRTAEQVMRTANLLRPDGSKNLAFIRALIEKSYPGPVPRTAKKAVSTSAETIEKCNHSALQAMVDHAAASKILSTYVEPYKAGIKEPIHCRYNVLVGSGRTSCSEPNWQNQPRLPGIRECIIPRPGYVFVACDYDSQELRTLAQSCVDLIGKSNLAKRYQDNPAFDPHTALAAQLLKIPEAEALRRKAAGDKELKAYRQHAKAANFGFPGGMGAEGFVDYAHIMGIKMDVHDAKRLRNKWIDTWPEMERYLAWIGTAKRGAATLTLPRSGRKRGQCGYCDGANFFFQGLAADASKSAAFLVAKKCYNDRKSALWGCRPIIFVHDEIIMEAPEAQAPEAAEELAKTMMDAMQIWTPDVPVTASPALMRRWHKEAEPVRDSTGRLIPWTPS